MEFPEKKGWSLYLAGALRGILFILSVWIAGKHFGAFTTFVPSAGMIEKIICPERIATTNRATSLCPLNSSSPIRRKR